MTSYFAWIVDFVGRHPHYALTAIFLLALSEAVPVVGTVVPGSTLIVGICALATGAHVNPWPLLGAAIVGAIFGDGLSFWLGHRYHRELLLRWPLNDGARQKAVRDVNRTDQGTVSARTKNCGRKRRADHARGQPGFEKSLLIALSVEGGHISLVYPHWGDQFCFCKKVHCKDHRFQQHQQTDCSD